MSFLGIDVGRKHCLVAHTTPGQFPTVVANKVSNPITPSCVLYDAPSRTAYVGEEAHERRFRFPQYVVPHTPYRDIAFFRDALLIDSLLADVRGHLEDAEQPFDPAATCVTLAVPSEMSDAERRAYARAVRHQFGFRRVTTLRDVDAAAQCLQAMHMIAERTVLIVDVGSHHTTAAVFRIGDGTVECKAHAVGLVGGDDLDARLFDAVRTTILERHKVDLLNPAHLRCRARAEHAVERARILLSTIPETTIEVDGVADCPVTIKMTRERMHALVQHEMQQIEQVVRQAVAEAATSIDQVEIIGGTGRAPGIQQLVRNVVGSEVKFLNSIDSACCVALGGAVYSERHHAPCAVKTPDQQPATANEKPPHESGNEPTEPQPDTHKDSVATKEQTSSRTDDEKEVLRPVEEDEDELDEKAKETIEAMRAEVANATAIIRERERKLWVLNDVETAVNQYRGHLENPAVKLPAQEVQEIRRVMEEMEAWVADGAEEALGTLEEGRETLLRRLDEAGPTLSAFLARQREEQRAAKEKADKMRAEHVGSGETARKRPEPRTNAEKLAAAEQAKEKGTVAFKDTDWVGAVRMYTKALGHVEAMFDTPPEMQEKADAMRQALLLNLSIAYLKLNKPRQALDNVNRALERDPKNVKGLFRKGMALAELKNYEEALAAFKACEALEHSAATTGWIATVSARIKQETEQRKKMAQRMFGLK